MDGTTSGSEKSRENISQRLGGLGAHLQSLNISVAELQRSNAELDRFASVAAHDLRSPLTSLTLCLSAINQNNIDSESRELLSQAHDSVDQMSKLITDLLTYAQIGTGELRRTACDANAVLAKAVASVHAMAAGIDAVITHDPLPVIGCDETLIIQLFQNLLENCLKYSKTPPRIHISSQMLRTEHLFSVADHGIGIAADYLEDIFKPFTRFHGGEYPGTGLGLATCRRIVDRHKGRLWVDSKLGDGSTFFFTLPK